MAHFARVDESGVVRQVIVVSNEDAPDEATGQKFIESIGLPGQWVQTSYNATMRGAFAGVGYTWDGKTFNPPQQESPVVAYERGKAEGVAQGIAEAVTLQGKPQISTA